MSISLTLSLSAYLLIGLLVLVAVLFFSGSSILGIVFTLSLSCYLNFALRKSKFKCKISVNYLNLQKGTVNGIHLILLSKESANEVLDLQVKHIEISWEEIIRRRSLYVVIADVNAIVQSELFELVKSSTDIKPKETKIRKSKSHLKIFKRIQPTVLFSFIKVSFIRKDNVAVSIEFRESAFKASRQVDKNDLVIAMNIMLIKADITKSENKLANLKIMDISSAVVAREERRLLSEHYHKFYCPCVFSSSGNKQQKWFITLEDASIVVESIEVSNKSDLMHALTQLTAKTKKANETDVYKAPAKKSRGVRFKEYIEEKVYTKAEPAVTVELGDGVECPFCSFFNPEDATSCQFCKATLPETDELFNEDEAYGNIDKSNRELSQHTLLSTQKDYTECLDTKMLFYWLSLAQSLCIELKDVKVKSLWNFTNVEENVVIDAATKFKVTAKKIKSKSQFKNWLLQPEIRQVDFSPTDIDFAWESIGLEIEIPGVTINICKDEKGFKGPNLFKLYLGQFSAQIGAEISIFGLEYEDDLVEQKIKVFAEKVDRQCFPLFRRDTSTTEEVEIPDNPWNCNNCNFYNGVSDLRCRLCKNPYSSLAVETKLSVFEDGSNASGALAKSLEIPLIHKHGINLCLTTQLNTCEIYFVSDILHSLEELQTKLSKDDSDSDSTFSAVLSTFTGDTGSVSVNSSMNEGSKRKMKKAKYRRRKSKKWSNQILGRTVYRNIFCHNSIQFFSLSVESDFQHLSEVARSSGVSNLQSALYTLSCNKLLLEAAVQQIVPPALEFERRNEIQRSLHLRQLVNCLIKVRVQNFNLEVEVAPSLNGSSVSLLTALNPISLSIQSSLSQKQVQFATTRIMVDVETGAKVTLSPNEWIFLLLLLGDLSGKKKKVKAREVEKKPRKVPVAPELHPQDIISINKLLNKSRKLLFVSDVKDFKVELFGPEEKFTMKLDAFDILAIQQRANAFSVSKVKLQLRVASLLGTLDYNEVFTVSSVFLEFYKNCLTLKADIFSLFVTDEVHLGCFLYDLLRQKKIAGAVLNRLFPKTESSIGPRKGIKIKHALFLKQIKVLFDCFNTDKANYERFATIELTNLKANILENHKSQIEVFKQMKPYFGNSPEARDKAYLHGFKNIKVFFIDSLGFSLFKLYFEDVPRPFLNIQTGNFSKSLFLCCQLNSTHSSTYFSNGELVSEAGTKTLEAKDLNHNAAPMKLYSKLHASAEYVEISFGFGLLKYVDTFAKAIQGLVPQNRYKEPKPEKFKLAWWDNTRYVLNGLYELKISRVWFFFQTKNEQFPLTSVLYDFREASLYNCGYGEKIKTHDEYQLPSEWVLESSSTQVSVLDSLTLDSSNQHTLLTTPSARIKASLLWTITNEKGFDAAFEHQVQLYKECDYATVLDWFSSFRPDFLDVDFKISLEGQPEENAFLAWCFACQESIFKAFSSHAPSSTGKSVHPEKKTLGKLLRALTLTINGKHVSANIWPNKYDSIAVQLKTEALSYTFSQVKAEEWVQTDQTLFCEGIQLFLAERLECVSGPAHLFNMVERVMQNTKKVNDISFFDSFANKFEFNSLFTQLRRYDWFAENTNESTSILNAKKLSIKLPLKREKKNTDFIVEIEDLEAKYNLLIRDMFLDMFFALRKLDRNQKRKEKMSKGKSTTGYSIMIQRSQFRLEAERDIVVLQVPKVLLNSTTAEDSFEKFNETLQFKASDSALFVFDPDSSAIDQTMLNGWIRTGKLIHWNKVVKDFSFILNHSRTESVIEDVLNVETRIRFDIPNVIFDVESSDFFALMGIVRNLILIPPRKENVSEVSDIKNGPGRTRHQSVAVLDENSLPFEDRPRALSATSPQKGSEEISLSSQSDSEEDTANRVEAYLRDGCDLQKALKLISRDAMVSTDNPKDTKHQQIREIEYSLGSCKLNLLDNCKNIPTNQRTLHRKVSIVLESFQGFHSFDSLDVHRYKITLKDFNVQNASEGEIFGAHLASSKSKSTTTLLSIEAELLPRLLYENIQVNLYKRWKLSIFQGSSYKFQLVLDRGLSEFLSEYFKDDDEEDDLLFTAIESNYQQMLKTKSDTQLEKEKKWTARVRQNLSGLKNFLQAKDGKNFEVIHSGWIAVTRKDLTSSGPFGKLFNKKRTKCYWCDMRCSLKTPPNLVFFHSEKRLKQSKKVIELNDIICLSWSSSESNAATMEFETLSFHCSVGRKPGSESRYTNLKWAATILPGAEDNISADKLVAEIFADYTLASHYEFVKGKLDRQIFIETKPNQKAVKNKVDSAQSKVKNKKETLLFFNFVKMSKIRLKLSMDRVPLGSSLPFDLSGTYTLNVPEFHLHSQLMSWRKFYKGYRYHALKGIVKSLILPRRRGRTISVDDIEEIEDQ